ncbi:MAG: phage replisome organizer N-terminal domain-containing protein, partial [Clostridia bacterium]|nr:phage replisome organizer N-terminal domain-containing protein [Clostridia bacterium]
MANGTAGKRYYWLRLHDDFFDTLHMKKLRRMENGGTLIIIYQKMLLKAIKTDGALTFSGLEEDIESELALLLGEEVENVRATLVFLEESGLMKRRRNGGAYFPEAVANTGSETASTQRSRECRARAKAKEKALHCNNDATQTQRLCSVEKEIEKEIETDTRNRDIERDREEKVLTGEETSPSRPCLPAGNVSLDNSAGKYGEYRNVKLSDDELNKVKTEFPSD